LADPFSVRPSSQAPPVEGEPFTLRCVGPQEPASITWLKNQLQMPNADEWVHFSPDNATITFGSLVREDGGLYRCVVVEGEGGVPTRSVGYLMQVNCEYTGVRDLRCSSPHPGTFLDEAVARRLQKRSITA